MIELRKALMAHLKTIHPRVYFQVSPDDAVYPYLVVDFPNNSDDGEGLQAVVVDVDGWDNNTDTTLLETLMKAVNDGLNKKTLTNESLAVNFYVDTKLSLTDTDPRIRRRKYTYQARLFERT
jgi:hypothetical protein